MASHAPAARPQAIVLPVAAIVRHGLWLSVGTAILVRLAAMVVFDQPVASDGLAYFTMARTLVETGTMADNFGLHAFYSPGYPLLLAAAFAVFGAASPVGLFVNLALAGASAALVWRLTRAIGGGQGAATLAGLGYALWLPAIWAATDLGRENLSTPLLLGFALAVVRIAQGSRDWRVAAVAGALFGAGLLAGTSIALTAVAFAVALGIGSRRDLPAAIRPAAAFALAALLVVTPWLATTNATLGRPVLTTNGPFNLYIGNNPAADGTFVSVRHTPAGPGWHDRLESLGELGNADWLADETRAWIAANPGRAAVLAAKKLVLFWAPNLPDAADVSASPALAAVRLIDLVQWAAILALAGLALIRRDLDRRVRWTIAALVAGFWLIHGATYIIPRYRDPVMPLLIAFAAFEAARRLRALTAR